MWSFFSRHSEGSLTAGVLVALIAATIVLFIAVPRLSAVASAWDVDCSESRCLSMPAWFPESALAEVRTGLATLESINLDGDLAGSDLERRLLTASPWFRDVQRASQVYPRKMLLRVSLRQPLVLLENEGALIPIDREGVVLPPTAAEVRAVNGLPVTRLRGCRVIADAEPGKVLQVPELLEGLAAALEIGGVHQLVSVDAISVGNVPRPGYTPQAGRPEITIETTAGVPLWWGRSRRSPNFGSLEVPIETKIRNLRKVLERYPGLNNLIAVSLYLDVASVWDRQMVSPSVLGSGDDPPKKPASSSRQR
jgi:hypothetical protein